jgi:thiol-disulfide isomerase/thioredoxin
VIHDKRRFLLFGAVAVVAATVGVLFNTWRLGGAGAGKGAAEAVFAARLANLQGEPQSIGQWRGQVLVVNFWATWCAPCREEIPTFVKLQDQHRARGVQFVGIAIDRRDPVLAFVREFGINYPVLLGGIETIELSRQAGNRAGTLPFTLVFDRTGNIVATEVGVVKETWLRAIIEPLL